MITRFVCWIVLAAAVSAGAFAQTPTPSDAFRKDFIEKFQRTGLNTTPADAMLLRILVESMDAKRGVEVGAASGFGAINMGIAFERTGGQLFSMEIDPLRVQETRQNIKKMGLGTYVTVVEGDALKTLPKLVGEFDFVFLDANKPDYLKYLKLIEPKLRIGSVIVADNVIVSERQMSDFLAYVRTGGKYETVTVRASDEKGDGMTISYKVK